MPLRIIRQDITKIKCDAIVNPTSESLVPTGGADAAIHAAAGPELLRECMTLGGVAVGEAKITSAYGLPSRYVIHTAGPVWQGGGAGERESLRSCYGSAMRLAIEKGCRSVALPLISSGLYGYPKESVLREAVEVITGFLYDYEMEVYIVVYDKTAYSVSRRLFSDVVSFIDNHYVATHSDEAPYRERRGYSPRRLAEPDYGTECETGEESPLTVAALSDGALSEESLSDALPEAASRKKGAQPVTVCASRGPVLAENCSVAPADLFAGLDRGFAETLFYYIDKKGITDVECYKRSNVGKKTFSKIKCNRDYRPSKITAVSFAIGLHLNYEETAHLLSTAGMCLSRSIKFDVIIEYFIRSGNYETIFDVNEVLYQFDQSLLGV